MSKQKFIDEMTEAVLSLPHDLKGILRLIEDHNLDEDSRVMLAGGVLYVLSSGNAVPGVRGALQHVGYALLLRLALARVSKSCPDEIAKHVEDEPELLGELEARLETARAFLGDKIQVLDKTVDGLAKSTVHGHSAKQCANDGESGTWLYDAVNEAMIDRFEFDEDDVSRDLRDVSKIADALATRMR